MRAVDLFAGCGGLSLGLELAGIKPVVAIEKSDMAAETHFRNFHLRGKPFDDGVWQRLLQSSIKRQAKKGTVVQDILDVLNDKPAMEYIRDLKPDVVAGGPPCQGFSMAGRRNPEDQRNELPWAFLRFVEFVRPRAVIIENVVGINRRFSKAGVDAPFDQLRQALAETDPGYVVQPVELNARNYGVPQNRPRMMLIAIRTSIAEELGIEAPSATPWRSEDAAAAMNAGRDEALPPLAPVPAAGAELTAAQALADLDDGGYAWDPRDKRYRTAEGAYARTMRFDTRQPSSVDIVNHAHRNHSDRVVERFRLYAHLRERGLPNSLLGVPFKYDTKAAAREELEARLGGKLKPPKGVGQIGEDLVDAIIRLKTKKHTQRAIRADQPAPTVVTLPDDYIHPTEPRIMTVRELARFQSFPDWFEFRNKETTGAHRRRVEVPQFTQVGNAVPPLLGKAVGETLASLLRPPTVLQAPARSSQAVLSL